MTADRPTNTEKTGPKPSPDMVSETLRVLDLEALAISECAGRIRANPDKARAIHRALELFQSSLERKGKIVVTGVGKSGKIAQKIAATLCSTGSLAVFLHPTEGLHGDLGLLTGEDSVLALSHTGNTDELLRLIPSFRKLKIPVIGIGGNSNSRLAEQCDVWIDGSVRQEACSLNLAPTSSTTLALALGDALAVSLMQLRGFDLQSFAQNHPGGALGNRLTLRVSDVMHSGTHVPTISPDASMADVAVRTTEMKLGAVLVTEGPRLAGLITDGDLRRALQHREKFFQLKAREVMTTSPTTVRPELLAVEALRLMENRPSPINVLPVVDEHGHWKGLVHFHDLSRHL